MKNRSLRILLITAMFSLVFSEACFAGGFYRHNIDDLAHKARQRIKEIERKAVEEEIRKELEEVFAEIQGLFEEAESLFKVDRHEEAARLYRKIDELSKDKEIKKLLKKADKY